VYTLALGTRVYAGAAPAAQAVPKSFAKLYAELDAKRYRQFFVGGLSVCFMGVDYYSKQEADAAIDAAMKGKP